MSVAECVAVVGIDWASERHAVCLVEPRGGKPRHATVDQQPEALDAWVAQLKSQFPQGAIAVCLEQSRGALIYALMKHERLVLYPINPKQLARYREAVGPSGAKDDPTDAQLLAEFFLKHSERLRAWKPDDAETRLVRFLAEDRRHLVDQRTAVANRLLDRLKQCFPLALEMFGKVSSDLACALLLRWSSFETLRQADPDEVRAFYREHHLFQTEVVERRLERLAQATPLVVDSAIVESGALQIRALSAQIAELNKAIDEYDARLETLMQRHEDAGVFQSFPGAGAAMAPRLLTAFGSDRGRWEGPHEIQQYAGVAPVAKRSGKSNVVQRRWACNKFLLQTFHEFAAHSRKFSVWAKAYYDMLRARGAKHHAAVRALAFKWIRILYRCWKSRTEYDELLYTGALIKRNSPIVKFMTPSTPIRNKK